MSYFQQRLEAYPRLQEYHLAQELGYWPYYKTVESAATPRFTIEGTDYINFGSNNYLSLSYHPQVIEAAQRATAKYGTGVTGSRLPRGDARRTARRKKHRRLPGTGRVAQPLGDVVRTLRVGNAVDPGVA